jgi:hypothetical protein
MSARTFEPLDARNPAAVLEYERAFYHAFMRTPENRLVHQLWAWNYAEQRVATRIPYDEQVVFLGRNAAGQLETAMATNLAMRSLQSATYGFLPPADASGCCEILTFFGASASVPGRLAFWAPCFEDLRGRGFHTAVSTIGPRSLAYCRRFGAQVLDERQLEGETRYYIKVSLDRVWLKRKPANGLAL